MKKVMTFLSLLTISLTSLTTWADGNDIKTSVCSKNSAALYIEISGQSALKIYYFIAKTIGVSPRELGGTEAFDMNCSTTKVSEKLEPIEVKCSYLLFDGKAMPYPQTDPGFSGQPVIDCD